MSPATSVTRTNDDDYEYQGAWMEDLTNQFDEFSNDDYFEMDEVGVPAIPDEQNERVKFDTICLQDFVELKLPAREHVLTPIIPERGLAMLFAGRGVGKTHVALGMAYAVSCGSNFLRWRAERAREVLYIDGEMPQEAVQERVLALMAQVDVEPEPGAFRLLSMDRQSLGTSLNLADPKHQKAIDEQLGDAEFLVLDNLSTLVNGGPENDAESWISMQAWLLQLRRRGVAVLVVHHAGRGGNARGTSKREDVLNTVILLKHPKDYDPSEGARFEVHLTKARSVYGDEALAFEARLDMKDGNATWVCSDLNDGDADDIATAVEMSKSGSSVRDIADKLQISKSAAHRLLKKAKRTPQSGEADGGPPENRT